MKMIILFFTMALMSAISASAQNVEIDGIYYDLDKNSKTATITNNGKKDAPVDFILSEYIDGELQISPSIYYEGETYSVTKIGIHAFYRCPNLISIEIPNSVTEIESWAFSQCSSLTNVKLPNTLKSLEPNIFSKCSSLATIDIPKSIEYIGESAFKSCTSLSSITIPNSVKYIEAGAFKDCTRLTSINIPHSVTSIGEQAFKGCSELASINIGNSLPVITYQTFWGCDKLESVTVLTTTPPESEWGEEAFSYYGTLHVRKGCKEAYSNALYWKNFNIVEDADAGTEDYTYTPMFEKGKVWKYDTTIRYRKMEVNTFYTVSVVDGPDEKGRFTLCKSFNDEGLGDEYLIPDQYYTVQESDKVVSYCPEYTNDVWPLMDFNMMKGDKSLITGEDWVLEYCEMNDELISVKGRAFRRLDVKQKGPNGSAEYDDYWVEGIGSRNGHYLTLIPIRGSWQTPGGMTYWFWGENLNSVYKDGECIFKYDDFTSPGMAATAITTVKSSAKDDDRIYNLQGQRLTSAPREGIYIKNGRKVLGVRE